MAPAALGGSRFARTSGRWKEAAALWIVVMALLLPLARYPYFPTQDGPAHLQNAAILNAYDEPAADHLRQYYTLSTRFDPTWLGHLALAGLLAIASAPLADKIFVAGYALAFVLALRYALRGIHRRAASLAFLGLPFVFNHLLHLGFYSFCYSVAAALLAIGWCLRERRWSARRTLGFGGLVLLVWALHPVSALVVMVFVASMGAAELARTWRAGRRGTKPPSRQLAAPVLACLPAALAALALALRQRGGSMGWLPWGHRWWSLATGDVLVAYNLRELWVARVFVLFLAAVSLAVLWRRARRPRLSRCDGLLLSAVAVTFLYWTLPDRVSVASYISARLGLFALVLLTMWLAAQPFARRTRRLIAATGASITLLLAAARQPAYRALSGQLRDYLSVAPHLEPGTTLLPLCFARRGVGQDGRTPSMKVEPFLHAAGWLAVERQVVDLSNYEAMMGVFPVDFRPELDPFRHILPPHSIELAPARADITGYAERTPGRIDYVLVWGLAPGAAPQLEAQLVAGWEPVYISPAGYAELYRRR